MSWFAASRRRRLAANRADDDNSTNRSISPTLILHASTPHPLTRALASHADAVGRADTGGAAAGALERHRSRGFHWHGSPREAFRLSDQPRSARAGLVDPDGRPRQRRGVA